MCPMELADHLVTEAISSAMPDAIRAAVNIGPDAVASLASLCEIGFGNIIHDPNQYDAAVELASRLAEHYPVEFLKVFNDVRWITGACSTIALVGLGCTHRPEAIAILRQVLFSPQTETLRARATTALGEIQHPDAIDALVDGANDDQYLVRYNAVRALLRTQPARLDELERSTQLEDTIRLARLGSEIENDAARRSGFEE